MIGEVTVPFLVQLITAGDVVDGDPAAPGELVQGGQLPRHQCRGGEPGAVRDEHFQRRGRVEHVGGHGEAVRAGGAVADQHPVETGLLVRLGEAGQVAGVDDRALEGAAGFGDLLGPHHANDLDRHSRRSSRAPGATAPFPLPAGAAYVTDLHATIPA